jgi:hypothetical protein
LSGRPCPRSDGGVESQEGQQQRPFVRIQALRHRQAGHEVDTEQAGISLRVVQLSIRRWHGLGRFAALRKGLRQAFRQMANVFDRALAQPLVAVQPDAGQPQKFLDCLRPHARQGIE